MVCDLLVEVTLELMNGWVGGNRKEMTRSINIAKFQFQLYVGYANEINKDTNQATLDLSCKHLHLKTMRKHDIYQST